jgi:hypothetical protein
VVSFTPRPLDIGEKVPGSHWVGIWVGYRAGLRKFLSLQELELLLLGRLARSQSLYGLRYSKELKKYQDELSSIDTLYTLNFTKTEPLVFL